MTITGASGNKVLSALWYIDPAQGCRILIKALDDNGGDIQKTSWALNVGRTTLTRWINNNPNVKKELERIRKRHGMRIPGRRKSA